MYQPLDGGFPLAIKMIQKTNMNVLLSKQNKDALLGNFIKEVKLFNLKMMMIILIYISS